MELGLDEPEPEPRFHPRRFGDYELLEQLGRGGMGVVYRASQTSLNRTVALKMLLDSQHDSPIAIRRFQIEAEAAARLCHPNIVPIHEIGDEDGQCFFSMQLIEGITLAQRIAWQQEGGQIKPSAKTAIRQIHAEAVRLIVSVARAVEYAHTHGVLHRDLKPANILIDAHGKPHLTDFGLAKLADTEDRLSQTGAAMGTPSYMSPEQADGGRLTVATDVYSLGVILYEILTGRLPFTAQTPLELAQKIATQQPRGPRLIDRAIDPDLETICLKCLEKDPRRRYASAALLADDMERWQRGETIMARPVGLAIRASRWIYRNPVAACLIGSLFAILIAALSLATALLNLREADEKQRKTEIAFRAASDRERMAREHIMRTIGVREFWMNPDTGPLISSEVLAWAGGIHRAEPIAATSQRYRIGMLLEEKDTEKSITSYAPLIDRLERLLGDAHRTIRLDIRVYKQKSSAIEALKNHEVHMLKIGGASYLDASRRDPGIKPLVAQLPTKLGVIFTRKDNGIDSLVDLIGKTIAIGDRSSTVAMNGTLRLRQAGVPTAQFRSADTRKLVLPEGRHGMDKVVNEWPISAVAGKLTDAGIISENVLKRANNPDLVILETFPSFPVYWLAGSDLPAEFGARIKDAMINLRDKNLFENLTDKVRSYGLVTPEEVLQLRAAATSIEEGIENSAKAGE